MKFLLIGDTHYGAKGNSQKFNRQLNEFMRWCSEEFTGKVDKVVQLGDWFDNRSKVQVDTLNFAIKGAKILKSTFGKENVITLTGNHDLYYLDRLDVSSLEALSEHITVINEITPMDNCLLVPWIISGEMWDRVVDESENYDYCFAHFELNGFKVNDAYTMEHGYSPKGLKKFDTVVSGHYHSPQVKDNIMYAGTPLPITNNEANEDHGVYILDTETGDIEFYVYDKVKVLSIPYTEIDSIKDLDPENTSVRIEFPDDIEDETLVETLLNQLKEMNFSDAKVKYRGSKAKKLIEQDIGNVSEVENIDEVVIKYLSEATPVDGIDNDLLKSLYLTAMETDND